MAIAFVTAWPACPIGNAPRIGFVRETPREFLKIVGPGQLVKRIVKHFHPDLLAGRVALTPGRLSGAGRRRFARWPGASIDCTIEDGCRDNGRWLASALNQRAIRVPLKVAASELPSGGGRQLPMTGRPKGAIKNDRNQSLQFLVNIFIIYGRLCGVRERPPSLLDKQPDGRRGHSMDAAVLAERPPAGVPRPSRDGGRRRSRQPHRQRHDPCRRNGPPRPRPPRRECNPSTAPGLPPAWPSQRL